MEEKSTCKVAMCHPKTNLFQVKPSLTSRFLCNSVLCYDVTSRKLGASDCGWEMLLEYFQFRRNVGITLKRINHIACVCVCGKYMGTDAQVYVHHQKACFPGTEVPLSPLYFIILPQEPRTMTSIEFFLN